jgi:thiosulfate dehydrogenase [quinone] large subunit
MFVSFLESVKYVGHLVPLSFLRIFMGYYYLQQALVRLKSDFLYQPKIAEQISEFLPLSHAPEWYKVVMAAQVVPHWQGFAFLVIGFQLALAISYIIGYVVRPISLLAVFFTLNWLFISDPALEDLHKTFLAMHFVFAWIGAGRCLGLDYYFYKRRRGIWW